MELKLSESQREGGGGRERGREGEERYSLRTGRFHSRKCPGLGQSSSVDKLLIWEKRKEKEKKVHF